MQARHHDIDLNVLERASIDIDTRLRLENEVRVIQNKDILDTWKNFIASKTEDEAQDHVVKLLNLLVDGLRVEQD